VVFIYGNESVTNQQLHEDETKKNIAAIYARVSSGKQVFGYSLDEQIRLAEERCKIMGWKIRYIFREDGESAGTTDRPKFQMMMEKARQQGFDILVFWKLDRFCRSLLDVVNVEKQLREYGVALHSCTEEINTTTSHGRFVFRTLANAAEWERDMIKERSRLGMKALASQNKWPNSHPPLGFNKGKDQYLKIDQIEAKLVKYVFKKYIELKSMPQLAFMLNKKDVKSKRGGRWTAASIKKILCNEIYIGHYSVAGVESNIKEYRIVSNNVFNKVQEIRQRHGQNVEPMPVNRKQATVERIFNEYMSYLKEEEQLPFPIAEGMYLDAFRN
jgi:site-specific DNA recombinase